MKSRPEQAEAQVAPGPALAAPLLTALLVTLGFIRIPRRPLGTDVDSGWCAVLDYARQHGLQFGADLAFTYGPLGFLTMPCLSPRVAWVQIAFGAGLCFMISASICLVAWRMGAVWRGSLLAVFIFLSANSDSGADLLMDLGILCWGLLCLVESGRRLLVSILCCAALAAVASLAKITFLFTAVLTIGTIALDLVLRRRSKLGFGTAGGFCAGLLFGWALAGQNLMRLGSFVVLGLAFTRAYAQTMGKTPSNSLFWSALVVLLIGFAMILLRSLAGWSKMDKANRWRRILWVAWLSSFLFINWKHGFVRVDPYHLDFFMGFVAMAGLALEGMPCKPAKARLWARGLAVACCVIALLSLQLFLGLGCLDFFVFRPLDRLTANLRHLVLPAEHWREIQRAGESAQRLAQLPKLQRIIGRSSVDVFGNEQSYAILNGLNYHPRPVFQSYAAYTPRLMQLNEQFYLSQRVPDFFLFRLAPIDRRFAPLEDPLLLRDLLIDCELIDAEGLFLLLKPRAHSAAKLRLLRQGSVRPGEPITLREYGEAAIWMEVDLTPSVRGRIRQFLYKAPEVRLTVERGTSKTQAMFRAPAPMMAAGFLASPLLLRTEDVLGLYNDTNVLRPTAFSVTLNPGEGHFWQETVAFRIYEIENGLSRRVPPRGTDPGKSTSPARVMGPLPLHLE